MIPQAYITAWRKKSPWQDDFQIEQDLVIERALVAIFSNPYLKERVAFRGGTALYKLHLKPPARYSEDIDLVQIHPEPIKETIQALQEKLSFLGASVIKQKVNNNTILYRFIAESNVPMRMKIEINCREHYTVFGFTENLLIVDSPWFTGEAFISSYCLEELLGTKLRALYQRKKGRDLFDLWYGITQNKANIDKIIEAWKFYVAKSGNTISRKAFLENLDRKVKEKEFLNDMDGLMRPGLSYEIEKSYNLIRTQVLAKI